MAQRIETEQRKSIKLSLFFKMIKKTDKTLTIFMKRKKIQIAKVINERGNIIANLTYIRGIMR